MIPAKKLEEWSCLPLGVRLEKLRGYNNYTQVDIARIIGCTQTSVSRWESCQAIPRDKTLDKFIELYELPSNYFLDTVIDKLKIMKKKK